MKEFKAKATIQATPETIGKILTHAPGFPEWDPNVERVEGTIAPGEKITVHTKFSERAFPVNVSEFVPNQKMVWSSGMPFGLFKGERTFTLNPQEDGSTKFAVQEQFTGALLFIIGRSIPDLSETFEQHAQGLKNKAEAA